MKRDICMHFRWNRINENGKLTPGNKDYDLQLGIPGLASQPRGGVTVAGIIKGEEIFWGISKCHFTDNFNRKKGAARANGLANSTRALKTKNVDYPIAKKVAELLANTNGQLVSELNLEEYIRIFENDPNSDPTHLPVILKGQESKSTTIKVEPMIASGLARL